MSSTHSVSVERHDHVDWILSRWAAERPDIDSSPMGVFGRIDRLSQLFGRELDKTYADFGITYGAFDVLASLRRIGPPYRLSPSELFNSLMLSSGAMTNRIDRLEEMGLVTRLADPDDRRGVQVQLTPKGRHLIDEAVAAHVAKEHEMLSVLSPSDRQLIAGLLRRLLVALGDNP